jgi:type II secretory ATPase GspE/PulE/Tfp pilus assembly ATPase PilB-like protein
LNDAESKIITLENPVEYKIKGINQSQIDASHDYSYAKGLRSILRQDPDIVMVGEIRDPETAEIAIQAALTGHLLLSTMHTNSAAGTIPRLLSMAVRPFLLAPALNVIIGQRLVRKLCPDCKKEVPPSKDELEKIKHILAGLPPGAGYQVDLNKIKFYQATGCDQCSGIGYKGRIGIFEVLVINEDIEKIILSGQISEYALHDIAVKQGMVTMLQDGILKALDGITTMEEVNRVTE